jgi:hypothetical protein
VSPDRLTRFLAAIVRARVVILVVYALLVPAAAYEASRIPSEGSIDKLIVPTDPDVATTRAFQALFPERQTVLLVFEAPDPWTAANITRVESARDALAKLPHVSTFWLLDALRKAHPADELPALGALARGATFFRKQGLVGEHFLTLVASLDVKTPAERDAALAGIDVALAGSGAVRKVGAPYVSSWIEREASHASTRAFPIFAVLLVLIAFALFRSWRTLLAIAGALGAAIALAVAAGGLLGFTFTIVSVLVPLTILVTTLATLVYLQARFVDRPADVPVAEHHLVALRNKFRPITASSLAAAMGFAALAVSNIRPVREMGIWTAIGLALAWIVAYTLFPALQLVLRTPTGRRGPAGDDWYERLSKRLPAFTYRWRWPLVAAALAGCAAGVLVLTGIPGVLGGARVEVDNLTNIDPDTDVYRDLVWFRTHVADLNVARVWIHLPAQTATDPEVLRAVDRFQTALEGAPDVTSVAGPTTFLRVRGYLAGRGEQLPADAEGFAHATEDLEELMLTEPELREFYDVKGDADLQLTALFRGGDVAGYARMKDAVARAWATAKAIGPALDGATVTLTGESMLQAKVGAGLVPTLAESFVLTAALIFLVFLVLFRSGLERLLAMIPSLFALLVAFLGMRIFGGAINVATIIIATTVLGTTENDQLHFFHHMHEKQGEPLEVRLAHAFHVSGRAIVLATFINAAGFFGLSISSFPPLRQFGLMTSSAFLLALAADFFALPAALWIASRERPRGP